MADTYDFQIKQYAVWSRSFVLSDNGVGRDLTGDTFKASLKRAKAAQDSPVLFTYEIGDGFAMVDAANGVFSWTIPHTDTAVMSGTYVYDILHIEGGQPIYLVGGTITVVPGVTEYV